MPNRRELFTLIRDFARGPNRQANSSTTSDLEPVGFTSFLEELRKTSMDVAADLRLRDVVKIAREQCYEEVFRAVISHPPDVAMAFSTELYRRLGTDGQAITELYATITNIPRSDGREGAAIGAALERDLSIRVLPGVRAPQEGDAERGTYDVSSQTASSRAKALQIGKESLLVHLRHCTSQIGHEALVSYVHRFGVSDDTRDAQNLDDYRQRSALFLGLLNQLRDLLGLGAADYLLKDVGGAPGGRPLVELLSVGIVPINGQEPSTVELVNVA